MPKIQRKTQKIFCNSADSDQIAVFGSMSTGNPVYSNDVEQLQSNEAYEIGWDAATLEDKAPFMEEMNGMQYGITKQLAYNFQEGIPEYDAGTTYYIGSIVKVLEDNKPVLYTSLTDENLGNSLTDGVNWEELQLGGGSGYQLFDTVLKDHVLTYEETKGLALQGTYVYKEALAGSRYGYPDFYNKCIQERNTATATQVTLGGSTITMYVASNGHQYYDIANKDVVDTFFGTMGSAWFYGVDTANERIFLPRDNYFAVKGDVSVAGNGKAFGITDGTNEKYWASYYSSTNEWSSQPATSSTGGQLGTTASGISYFPNDGKLIGVNTDATKSGIEGKLAPNTDKYLYICVGNTTNYEGITDVVNQGMEILEQVNEGLELKVDKDSMQEVPCITETYVNGSSWYRIYSDGWGEQGGGFGDEYSSYTVKTITLLKPFSDTNYYINSINGATGDFYTTAIQSKSTTGFVLRSTVNTGGLGNWYACGYIA